MILKVSYGSSNQSALPETYYQFWIGQFGINTSCEMWWCNRWIWLIIRNQSFLCLVILVLLMCFFLPQVSAGTFLHIFSKNTEKVRTGLDDHTEVRGSDREALLRTVVHISVDPWSHSGMILVTSTLSSGYGPRVCILNVHVLGWKDNCA